MCTWVFSTGIFFFKGELNYLSAFVESWSCLTRACGCSFSEDSSTRGCQQSLPHPWGKLLCPGSSGVLGRTHNVPLLGMLVEMYLISRCSKWSQKWKYLLQKSLDDTMTWLNSEEFCYSFWGDFCFASCLLPLKLLRGPGAVAAVVCLVLQGRRLPALPAAMTVSFPKPVDTGAGHWQRLAVSKRGFLLSFFNIVLSRTGCLREICACWATFHLLKCCAGKPLLP